MDDKLVNEIAAVIARECSMYADVRIEKERCIGAALRIVTVVEDAEKVKQQP